MKVVTPYLRVLAGMFAGICLWLAIVETIHGEFATAFIQLVFSVGLGYLAVGKLIRDRYRRMKAERDGLAARAEAGHRAYLAGDVNAAMTPPPSTPPPLRVRRGVVIAALLAAAFVLVGIISDISDGLDSPSDENTTTAPRTLGAPPTVAVSEARPSTSAATTARTVSPAAAAPTTAAAPTVVMPPVVCMDLQAAQDAIQAAGVFYSRSVDASGAGRAQIVDRNWVVVEQSPAPGVVIGEGDAVLSVVKDDELTSC